MKEKEIRSIAAHKKYLELVKIDSERIFRYKEKFSEINCPACDLNEKEFLFTKDNFDYVICKNCDTIFNDPRPPIDDFEKLYEDSESTNYWIKEFFIPFVDARKEKIFKPRAEYIAGKFPELSNGVIGDIGAGFGIFFEELKKLWAKANLIAIEPSNKMANICSEKGFAVIPKMIENIDESEIKFDLLTSFELMEHLHNPKFFLQKVNSLLKPGGCFYFTTLNGLGYDIQILWENSRSISPPHHLNFFNPFSMRILLERNGFEVIEILTPGKLDVEIVENSINENIKLDRFNKMFFKYATQKARNEYQEFLANNGFSSHFRIIARKI